MDIQGDTDLIDILGEAVKFEKVTLELQKNLTPEKQSSLHPISVSTSVMHIKRKRAKAPIMVSKVRRSERIKGKCHGFKSVSYSGRNYICCDTKPPTLSDKLIMSLGTEFCKISPML
jgi:hypothetical protein